MSDILIVGIGNPFRSDDGAGWAVIDALEGQLPEGIRLCKQRGEISELMDVFAHYPIVYLVDACQCKDPVGSWQRIDALEHPLLVEALHTSTHGFGVAQAVAMARNIQQIPSQLIIYAISANKYHIHDALSPPVASAIPAVARAITEDIHQCMKKALQKA